MGRCTFIVIIAMKCWILVFLGKKSSRISKPLAFVEAKRTEGVHLRDWDPIFLPLRKVGRLIEINTELSER